jgi:small conductance mechanosensitive channel
MQKILVLLLLFGSVALPMVSQADASMTSEQLIEKIAQDQRKIARYKAAHKAATEEDAQLLMLQFLQREQQLRANLSWLVEKVIAGDSDHKDQALAIVMAQSEVISKEILFIDTAVEKATAERGEAETVIDTMTADQKINHANVVLDDYLNAFLINSQQLDQLGAATASNIQSKKLDKLLNHYAHKAEGQLALAKMSLDNVSGLLAYAPEESKAELLSKKNVLAHKTRNIAASMSRRIALMDIRGLDTATFHVLLLGTTGQLSGDIFDSKVVRDIVSRAAELLSNWFLHNGVDLIWQLLLFIAILVAFKALSKIAVRVVETALRKSKLNVSALLLDFFVSTTSKVVMVIGVLIAFSQLGIQLTPLLAGLGMAGVVIGFALQDTLSNFASGMMILLYRPFDVGDLIEAAGVTGLVSNLTLVSTTVRTLDNQSLVVPNSKIWGDVIRNVTDQKQRRVDMVFGIGYSDDIPKAEEVLMSILKAHDKVLPEPEPNVKLHTLNESSVDFIVRPWVKTIDYWDVYWDVTREVKQRFDAENISIPFPQRDVHVYKTE